jgi:hypothetical protein
MRLAVADMDKNEMGSFFSHNNEAISSLLHALTICPSPRHSRKLLIWPPLLYENKRENSYLENKSYNSTYRII